MSRLVVLAVLALVGSVASPPVTAADDTALTGRSFHSIQITEAGFDAPLVAGTTLSLVFIDSSHLGAWAGCNGYGAIYRLAGSHLLIKDDVETLIACPKDLTSQEQWLFDFLRASPAAVISGSSLALGEGDLLIQFIESDNRTASYDPLSI
jgi:heat shock protein HslJ